MAKKAFITGAGGCIGRQLVDLLVHDDWSVTALLLPCEVDPFVELTAVNSVVGDIRDIPPEAIPKEAVIFHLAAKVHSVPGTAKEKEQFFSVNHDGTINIARNAVAQKANGFIFISTLAVYGERIQEPGCNESAVTEPVSVYGKSKLKAEKSLREILFNKVPYTILRPCAVYGPYDRGNFMSLVNWIVKRRLHYPLINGGKTRKNVLYVRDMAKVICYCGANNNKSGNIFNVANPDCLTMNEIVKTIARAANVDSKIINIPNWLIKPFALLGDVMSWILRVEMPLSSRRLKVMITDTIIDTSKLKSELMDQMDFIPFEDGMKQLLER